MNRLFPTTLVSLFLLLASLGAQAQLAPVRTQAGISEYALPNGLQVLLLADDAKPSATVNITYRVGSRHESAGETGSAHLLEHMLFKPSGSVTDPKRDMQALGMRWNGTTAFDRTNYFAHFLTNDAQTGERFDYMFKWLAGMMTSAKFTRDDLATEMTVVRNEWERAENEAGRILGERMRAAAYTAHGYRHSVLGAKSDIENIPVERLYAFYRRHYRPDNATLIVAGRFDEAVVKARIEAAFGAIQKPAEPLPATYSLELAQDGERHVVLRRAGGQASTAVMYHLPAGGTREGVAARLLAESLGQGRGPVVRGLVMSGLAASAFAYYRATREPGFLVVNAGLVEKPGDMPDAQFEVKVQSSAAALARVVESVQLSDAEIETARTSLLQSWRSTLRDAESTAQTLSDMVALGDWRLIFGIRDALQDIKADEVRSLARQYLVASNRTSGSYLPLPGSTSGVAAALNAVTPANGAPAVSAALRAPAPKIPGAADFVAFRADSAPIRAQADPAVAQAFENFEITPALMAQRTQRARLTVADKPGLQIAVLPRAAKDERVVGTLRLRWGTEQSLKGSNVLATMAGPLFTEGTADLPALGLVAQNAVQIKDRVQALDARISFTTGAGFATVGLDFPAGNAAPVLELVHQLLRAPRFADAAFERNQRAMVASLQNLRANPVNIAGNALGQMYRPRELFPQGDVREVRSFDETENLMRGATVAQLRDHWQRFASASVGELALVGPITLEAVRAPLQRLWGDWGTREPYAPWVNDYVPPAPAGTQVVRVADKANASYNGRIGFAMNESSPDFAALFTATQLMSRVNLWERVREKEGLSYGVSAALSVPWSGSEASINVTASFAPANREKLLASIRGALSEARDKGYGFLEVGMAKSAIVSRRAEFIAQPANAAGNLAIQMRLDRPLDFYASFTTQFQALDAAAVNAALKKYLDVGALREVVAGTFD
jgi:zinc protease